MQIEQLESELIQLEHNMELARGQFTEDCEKLTQQTVSTTSSLSLITCDFIPPCVCVQNEAEESYSEKKAENAKLSK